MAKDFTTDIVVDGSVSVTDEGYGLGWDSSIEVPTKNAVYDKIETLGGGGDVTKVGTPVDNELTVWTGDGTAEGDADLTWDGTRLQVGTTTATAGRTLTVAGAHIAGGMAQFVGDTHAYVSLSATSGSIAGFLMNQNNVTKAQFGMNSSGLPEIVNRTFSTEPSFIINDSGFVGIGPGNITSPSVELHVFGGLRVNDEIIDSTNSPGTSGQLLSSTVTGTDWIDPVDTGILDIVEDTTPQLGAILDLNQFGVELDPTPTVDHTSNGTYVTLTNGSGGTLNFGDPVVFKTVAGEFRAADADFDVACIGIVADSSIVDTASGKIFLSGFARDDTWNWTSIGSPIYVDTAGALTQTAPTATGDFVLHVGTATTADTMYVNPSPITIEIA